MFQLPACSNTMNLLNFFERIHISAKYAHIVLATTFTLGACKSMIIPDLSDWMAYHAPLIPWFWTFS